MTCYSLVYKTVTFNNSYNLHHHNRYISNNIPSLDVLHIYTELPIPAALNVARSSLLTFRLEISVVLHMKGDT
jgi:hypothetical protein